MQNLNLIKNVRPPSPPPVSRFLTRTGFKQRTPLARKMLEAINAPVLVIQVGFLQSFDRSMLTPSQLTRPVRIVTDISPRIRPLLSGQPQECRKGSEAVHRKRWVSDSNPILAIQLRTLDRQRRVPHGHELIDSEPDAFKVLEPATSSAKRPQAPIGSGGSADAPSTRYVGGINRGPFTLREGCDVSTEFLPCFA